MIVQLEFQNNKMSLEQIYEVDQMGDLRDIIKGTTFSVTTMGNTKHCYH